MAAYHRVAGIGPSAVMRDILARLRKRGMAADLVDSVYDPEQATKYYLKADEYGFLGRKGARWLLNYYASENIQIDELEKQRFLALIGGLENE